MSSLGESRRRGPKVGHTKSRGGCTKCRQRRVKCDQASPACRNCVRLGLECSYNHPQRRSEKFDIKIHSPPTTATAPNAASSRTGFEHDHTTRDVLEESKERRVLELRLLHHWMSFVSRPFMNKPAPRWGELWRLDLPLIAFKSDLVLHALLAMSATHLLPTISSDGKDHAEVLAARDQYLVVALQQQRTAVEGLNPGNVDQLSFAGLLISLNAFSMLRERSLESYEPPMAWLDMGRGAGAVMRQAAELAGSLSETKLSEILRTTAPIHKDLDRPEIPDDILQPYETLLNAIKDAPSDADAMDEDDPYRNTIVFIAVFRKAIKSGEPPYVHLRRICMFPFTVPARFIDHVRERRPLALIVLAHFFAVISHTEALQYLGNTGDDVTVSRREVVAIHQSLPERWHQLMIWPMDEVRAEM